MLPSSIRALVSFCVIKIFFFVSLFDLCEVVDVLREKRELNNHSFMYMLLHLCRYTLDCHSAGAKLLARACFLWC